MLPDYLKPFQKKAERLLEQGGVGEIEFSGSTYQVQVTDPSTKEEQWAFLQFNDKGGLRDRFCSCEGVEEVSACVHLAAAYLRIFNDYSVPLHERFQLSLWNRLCAFFAKEYGDTLDVLTKEDKDAWMCLKNGKLVFSANGKGLESIFSDREVETEETSLKFSNVPEEEIKLWREGRPSFQLRYELSFWNDLAKRLMLMQDTGQKYTIKFTYSPEQIPTDLSVKFSSLSLHFHLTGDCLLSIISSLSTVDAPLKVYSQSEDTIKAIQYDHEKGEMKIIPEPLSKEVDLEATPHINIGKWAYIPKKGFFSRRKHPLLEQLVYREKEIADLLNHEFSIVKSKLENVRLQEQPISLQYSLHFDSEWNLLIESYLYKKGDLVEPSARFFGHWAYVKQYGFIPLENIFFDEVRTIVPANDVGDFVTKNRAWFNHQENFNTHISGVETKLTYQLTEQRHLMFSRLAVLEDEFLRSKDFGSWIYVEGEGFYSKVSIPTGMGIRSGVSLNPDQIPLFINMYQDELPLVAGFFSEKCPVAKVGLKIELTHGNTVMIAPEFEFRPEYEKKEVLFFGNYSYVEKEGFHRLPSHLLLPERFRQSVELEKESLPRFFSFELEQLKDFAFWIDPRLTPPRELKLIADSLSLEKEGYSLKLSYQSERDSIKFSTIWAAAADKERFIFSSAGLIDLEEDRFKWIKKIDKNRIDRRSNTITLSSLELIRLNAYDTMQVKEGIELYRELLEFRTPGEPNIEALKSHLRPYQEKGLKWLWFLYNHHLSGLLCDDMGLGKTHQTMALIAAAMSAQKEKIHILVVCPTSVIYHWEEKLMQFLPHAKVCTFHGTKRSMKDFHEEYNILLTSYGIWRNESKNLSKMAFEVAVFDEIQSAKNQTSRIHASLQSVKARMRIGLTGTPIENRLAELKALFDLILPGYMPSEAEYKQYFIVPIEKENNRERKNQLSRYIKPFVLRRRKEEVLLDLPEKIEEIAHCELVQDQKILYNDVLHKVKEGLLRELEDKSTPVPYLHVFSVLSSLKQICNHPAAFLKKPELYNEYGSGKWDLFLELLTEALESNQKVVIFSQYLAMLDIMEKYLKDNNIQYASIRGATIERGEQVKRFNKDPSCTVFLGSLQAAGLGIDLTAGSVVIHYDRWWNAAREDQATDRVHRIGQMRGVQVFKLVTKGTLEEQIDLMITRKGKLMEEVVGVDDHRFIKNFERHELINLLRDVS